jgi:uncharacterized membrane protein required for colicin V production
VLVAGWTKLPATQTWSQSRFLPYVNPIAVWLDGMLPGDFDPGRVGNKAVKPAGNKGH